MHLGSLPLFAYLFIRAIKQRSIKLRSPNKNAVQNARTNKYRKMHQMPAVWVPNNLFDLNWL